MNNFLIFERDVGDRSSPQPTGLPHGNQPPPYRNRHRARHARPRNLPRATRTPKVARIIFHQQRKTNHAVAKQKCRVQYNCTEQLFYVPRREPLSPPAFQYRHRHKPSGTRLLATVSKPYKRVSVTRMIQFALAISYPISLHDRYSSPARRCCVVFVSP